jgi:hypothetical protein
MVVVYGNFQYASFLFGLLMGCEMVRDKMEDSDGYSYYYKSMNGNSYFWVIVFDRTTKE